MVRSVDDLPRASYPVQGSAADVLTAPPAAFEATVAPMRADIARILERYQIVDAALLRRLLEARLTAGLAPRAFLEARLAGGEAPGVCPRGFGATYARHLDSLPWAAVGVYETRMRGFAQVATPSFVTGFVAPQVQPVLNRAHALSNDPAWALMAARTNMDVIVPCRAEIVAATDAYIRKHAGGPKPDIWPAREAVLPPAARLTPVAVAIWDSGIDRTLFPGQLLTGADGRPVDGPAYDVEARPTTGALIPLSAEDSAAYPQMIADKAGISDLQNGTDGPAAAAPRQKLAGMTPQAMQRFMERAATLGGYMHGTHVAGIAARGNPAIRLVSVRMTYDNKPVPTPPTDEIQRRTAAMYGEVVAWLRAHRVRVVNMSWWDAPFVYEAVLEKNGIGKTAEERRRLARHYFDVERDGMYAALKSAPEILFVTIAGNNDSDNAFEETIPSSFVLPNLLVVGAVDQAGGRTSFTSTGTNVGVYANGLLVESVVPGGAKVRESGTSMAAPAVSNLAARLLAVDPALTPPQVIALIERTADAGDEPAIRRIDPKGAMERLCRPADAPPACRWAGRATGPTARPSSPSRSPPAPSRRASARPAPARRCSRSCGPRPRRPGASSRRSARGTSCGGSPTPPSRSRRPRGWCRARRPSRPSCTARGG
ncbi:hypothetical protein tb265_05740 [Gemmatimonadetes bacterium T265]|nr:hypothetical protein tb265_05740 [Gemmatimonadetes bacterium T265]